MLNKYKKIVIMVLLCIVSLPLVYSNDNLYSRDILKIDSIDTVKEEVHTNPEGFKEMHYIKEIKGTYTNGKKKDKSDTIEYEETYSEIDRDRLRVGDKVFIVRGEVEGLKRDFYVYLMLLIFFISISIIGKKQGTMSFLNVVVNALVFYLGLELYRGGVDLNILCFIEAILFTVFSLLFVTGKNKKTYCAIISTITSLIILVILLIIVRVTSFSSMNFNGLSYLTVPPEDVFFSSLMIGGLGAIMDVSITMSSSIYEILEKNPKVSKKNLKKSGFAIGQDIMGTMIGVLFFTYLSGELPLMVLALRNGITLSNFVTSNMSLEMTRFLIGAISIVMTIPISNYVSIKYFKGSDAS